MGSDSSSEDEWIYELNSVFDDRDDLQHSERRLLKQLREALIPVYLCLQRQQKIANDLKNFERNRGNRFEMFVNEINRLETRMKRIVDIIKNLQSVDNVHFNHGLDTPARHFILAFNVPPITEKELEETVKINQYCSEHVSMYCNCLRDFLL